MLEELTSNTFFKQNGHFFSASEIKLNAYIPFKHHAQFALIVDALARKHYHHVILACNYSILLRDFFLEALLLHLNDEAIPIQLRSNELLYLDLDSIVIPNSKQENIINDFSELLAKLNAHEKTFIVALKSTQILDKNANNQMSFLRSQIQSLLRHPRCRILVFNNLKHDSSTLFGEDFCVIQLENASEADKLSILQRERFAFEAYHQVIIPEELLPQAYSLAKRYLSVNETLEKAIQLMDSAAARASVKEQTRQDNEFKPVLNLAIFANVLATLTQIPATHLQMYKFSLNEFIHGMQQRIFGQDVAISIIANELQQSFVDIQQRTKPLCSFLFAGPAHTGKTTLALALVEQLFNQLNVLYFVVPNNSYPTNLADIKLKRCIDKTYHSLKEIILQTPYAVILFENVEKLPTSMLTQLQELLSNGNLIDNNGDSFDCSQAIILLSTTTSGDSLSGFKKNYPTQESQELDLMQLVLGTQTPGFSIAQQLSSQEIIEEILPILVEKIPHIINSNIHIVPFTSLNKTAIEKIIRAKLKAFAKLLEVRYGIEFGYAQEIMHFLVNETQNKNSYSDDILKQLYLCVEHAITNRAEHNKRSNQLFLQLNETGQLLKAEWLGVGVHIRQHAS